MCGDLEGGASHCLRKEISYEEKKDLAKETQEEIPEQYEQTYIDNNEMKQLETRSIQTRQ